MEGATEERGPQAGEFGNLANRDGVTAEARLNLERIAGKVDRLTAGIEQHNSAVQLLDRRVDECRRLRLDRLSLRPALAEP